MKANEIKLFRNRLKVDKENLELRRKFHEQYEWLDGYWHNRYKGNNHINQFSEEFGEYFWNLDEFKDLARELSGYPPIGNSKRDFEPTISIQRATYYLRFCTDLFEIEFPNDNDDDQQIANNWGKSPFNAVITIIKQIRDNLFHGRKGELEEPQYTRNKELISMGVKISDLILNNLEKAEQDLFHTREKK